LVNLADKDALVGVSEVIELDEEDLDHENRESSTVENTEVINSTESSSEVTEEIDQD